MKKHVPIYAKPPSPRRILGAGSIALMTIAATDSLRNIPSMAVYGWSSVSWFLLGTLLFLIPMALISAELATGWPLQGGVYAWVNEAFGKRYGFLAVWCEWVEDIVWFPSILIYVATSLAYTIDARLSTNKYFLLMVILLTLWGLTLVNLEGLRASILLERMFVIVGTIIPQILLILLGMVWLLQGKPVQIPFSSEALLPEIRLSTLPLVATVILLFAGVEMSGYYALETRRPKRDYPRAIFLSAGTIFALLVLSTISVSFVVPIDQLSLASGLMQAFSYLLVTPYLKFLLPVIGIMAALGAMATLTTWMMGPARGLSIASQQCNLPQIFHHKNRHQVPDKILLIQSANSSAFSVLLLFVPSINAYYWMLSVLTTQILSMTYIMLFASAIKLRYSQKEKPRGYRVPGGMVGIWIVGSAGGFSCLFVILIGFMPPGLFESEGDVLYTIAISIGLLLLIGPSLILTYLRKHE